MLSWQLHSITVIVYAPIKLECMTTYAELWKHHYRSAYVECIEDESGINEEVAHLKEVVHDLKDNGRW